jgi:hypothetical protein
MHFAQAGGDAEKPAVGEFAGTPFMRSMFNSADPGKKAIVANVYSDKTPLGKL